MVPNVVESGHINAVPGGQNEGQGLIRLPRPHAYFLGRRFPAFPAMSALQVTLLAVGDTHRAAKIEAKLKSGRFTG